MLGAMIEEICGVFVWVCDIKKIFYGSFVRRVPCVNYYWFVNFDMKIMFPHSYP